MISGEYRSEFFFRHEKVKSYQGHGVAGKYVIATKDMPEKHLMILQFLLRYDDFDQIDDSNYNQGGQLVMIVLKSSRSRPSIHREAAARDNCSDSL